MKNIVNLLIVVFIFLIIIISCEKHIDEKPDSLVYNGNAHFSYISIKRFNEIISDLQGKEVINGNIYIDLYFDNINIFKTIKKVTGDVIIRDMPQIESISFLSNLEEIGGDLEISNVKNLKNLYGLGKVPKVKSLILYENNPNLNINIIKDIEVTNNLKIVGIKINKIPKFKNISHLNGDLGLWYNTTIQDMSFLSNLEKVDSDIYLGNNSFNSLNGLNKLIFVGGNFLISNNPNLENLNGLNNLETVYGEFTIVKNPLITDLKGLNILKTAKESIAINNTKCTSLKGLENLIETKWLAIGRNSNLSDFCAIKPLILKNDSVEIRISNNKLNPTIEEIISNCP